MKKRFFNKLLSVGLLMGTTVSSLALAQNLSFEEIFERTASDVVLDFFSQNFHEIEISYEHANHDVYEDTSAVGVGVSFSVYTPCKGGVGDCRPEDKQLSFGDIDAGVKVVFSNGERDARVEMSNLKVSLTTLEDLDGGKIVFLSLAYQEDEAIRVIDFEVPLELLNVSKKIDFYISEEGNLKLHFLTGFSLGGSFYRHQYGSANNSVNTFGVKGSIKVEAGIQIFKRLDVSGHYSHSFESVYRQSLYRKSYGANVAFEIFDGLSLTTSYTRHSLNFSGHGDLINTKDVLQPPRVNPHDERFWQFGAGIKFEF